jgi:molybdopterin molybdotransferase
MSTREPRQDANRRPDWDDPDRMLGVDEARDIVLSAVKPLEPVAVPLLDALGLVLAEDVTAAADIPPFRNSAMDGYAVRWSDTTTAPVELSIVADIAAGSTPGARVEPGQAARIMTGAAMPAGADAVVRFEESCETERDGRRVVHVLRAARASDNVRQAGEDLKAGSVVLRRGRVLQPVDIGILASLDRATVRAHRRPRIAILSTGNEVAALGAPLRPGQIRDSNSYTLAALVRSLGGEPLLLGVARDEIDEIRAKLRDGHDADLLLTSGGVSLGDFDVVKDVLQAEGEIALWQVRIKPGKPMAFGRIGATPLLGLPGNPVAAVVAFLQFGRPALLKMLGRTDWTVPTVRARLTRAHENRGRRRHFVRGVLRREGTDYVVEPAGAQGSGILSSVAAANCFIVLPESWDHAPAGAMVDVELFDGQSLP